MAKQMSQCNLLILLLPPNIAVLTSSAFCLITQCYYLGAWKTPVWMTEVYRITSMIHFCGNSHIVCTDQLQLFTYTLLLAFREKGRERKAGRTVLLAHFPYPQLHTWLGKKDAFSQCISGFHTKHPSSQPASLSLVL